MLYTPSHRYYVTQVTMSDEESYGTQSDRNSTAGDEDAVRHSPPIESVDSEGVREQKLAQDCNEVIDAYRAGTFSSLFAYGRLSLLCDEGGDAGRDLFEPYSRQLRAVDDESDQRRTARPPLLSRLSERKRRRHGSPDASQDVFFSGSDTDGPGGSVYSARPFKRNKADSADETASILAVMPWTRRRRTDISTLRPDLRTTQKLIALIQKSFKEVKADIIAGERPSIPNGEWDNVLSGRALDLDKIFTGFHIVIPEDTTSRFGRFELIARGEGVATRVIRTHGDWVIAYNLATRAILFVFEHRRRELENYGAYIHSLFASYQDSMHGRVIEFDKSIRACASNRGDLELSDTGDVDFVRLEKQFLNLQGRGDGSGGGGSSNGRSKAKGNFAGAGFSGSTVRRARSQDACGRWNDNHPHSAEKCTYAHVCAVCRGDHTKGKCPKKA